jgi:hypothetical protein
LRVTHTLGRRKLETILHVDVRTGARKALAQLLEPLTEFVFDSGLSIKEFHDIFRAAAVRSVAARQLAISRRVNISGISASTGIARAEVSRILKTEPKSPQRSSDRHQQSTSKILSVWQQDPKFTNPNGQPADLKIYGRGSTFELLVKLYGRGIPTRAMLDELTRIRAIELRPAQLIRLRTGVAVERGMTPQVARLFGDRVSELMETLLQNMRNSESSAFLASVANMKVSATELPLIRREISSKGADFLSEIQDMLTRSPIEKRTSKIKNAKSLSVTIYYHEELNKTKGKKSTLAPRRNFRRSL